MGVWIDWRGSWVDRLVEAWLGVVRNGMWIHGLIEMWVEVREDKVGELTTRLVGRCLDDRWPQMCG